MIVMNVIILSNHATGGGGNLAGLLFSVVAFSIVLTWFIICD
jgi:hypothetical protein